MSRIAFLAAIGLAHGALASPFIVAPPGVSSGSGGAVTGAAGSCVIDDAVVFDNNGVQGCTQATDVAPQDTIVHSQDNDPGGTQAASDLILRGGIDEKTVTIDAFGNCAGDTVTVTIDGSATVLTEDGTSVGTGWDDATSNGAVAISLALAVDRLAGVSAVAVAAVVEITPDLTTSTIALAEGDATCTTVAVGTDGGVLFGDSVCWDLGTGAKTTLYDSDCSSAGALSVTGALTTTAVVVSGDMTFGNNWAAFANRNEFGSVVFRNTFQAVDSAQLTTGTTANSWLMVEDADRNTDFGHAQQTNPTLIIQSADDTDITQWISISHDQTDGIINTGSGGLKVNGATIAGGPTYKSFMFANIASGTHYIGGYYEAPAADADLTQASTTVTIGDAGDDEPWHGHAFLVSSGNGTVASGTVSIVVSGSSIDDAGNYTASDSETVLADITSAAVNVYAETTLKWVGQVTYTITVTSGAPATYSLSFNYGLTKHEDFGNRDFTINEVDCVGQAGASTSLDVELLHHPADFSGWTYHATAFVPGNGAVSSMSGTHTGGEVNLTNAKPFSFKHTGLTQAVAGTTGGGILFRVTTGANNAVDHMTCHLGVTL